MYAAGPSSARAFRSLVHVCLPISGARELPPLPGADGGLSRGDPLPGVDGASDPGGLVMAPNGLETPSEILDAQPGSVAVAPDGLTAQAEGADGLAQPAY